MRILGMRVWVILLVFAVTLAAFLGGREFLIEQRVHTPLEQRLAALPGVEEVEMVPSSGLWQQGPVHVRIALARDADLSHIYRQIQGELVAGLGRNLGQVELVDGRDPSLTEALKEMQFALEEGITTGAFREMAREVEAVARRYQVDELNVEMDRHFVYVSLHRNGAYLHHVVPRSEGESPGAGPPRAPALGMR